MSQALILDPFSGISGDMFLGALVDLGVDFDTLHGTLAKVPALAAVKATRDTVSRGAFSATRIHVECPHEHAHRSLSTIRSIIEDSDLSADVRSRAIDTFTRLAAAEAKVHGCDIEEIHFHEVGALDAIYDIVGAHVAMELIGDPSCLTRTLVLGRGETRSAHGKIPLPAPATVELLVGFPVEFSDRREELVTPTGAAIVATIASPLEPGLTVIPDRIGHGAGARESEAGPNVLRAMLAAVDRSTRPSLCILTSTIDDMNPEVYGFLMEDLLGQGALEVYFSSIMMKKNRPGTEITIITEERDVYRTADYLMANSTTLGVRVHREERIELLRRKASVETQFGTIAVKVAERPGGKQSMSPEYESCKEAALRHKVSLLDVYNEVMRAWDNRQE